MELSTHDIEQCRQRGYCVRQGFFDRAEIQNMRQSDGDLRLRYYRDKWASYPPNNLGQARGAGSYRV